MMDGDPFLAHGNLFDHCAQHFLFFRTTHVLHGLVPAAQKGFHRVAHLDPSLLFHRSPIQVLPFFHRGANLLLDLRGPSS